MEPSIEVRIEDGVFGDRDYKFRPTDAQNGKWHAVPRVGDVILDLNEFPYTVERVVWYDPHFVRLTVKSARNAQ